MDETDHAPASPVTEESPQPAVSAEDLAWEGAGGRTAPASATPVLRAGGIEGPLDWVLEQARAGRIDLARLSVLALVEQCVAAVDAVLAGLRGAEQGHRPAPPSLERLADWLVMAAWLAWLRSGLLLPGGDPEAQAARDEAEALRQRLASRERVRVMAALLDAMPRLGRDVWARGRPASGKADAVAELPALLRAYARLFGPAPEHKAPDNAYRPRPPLLWPVAEILARMLRLLPEVLGAAAEDGVELWGFLPAGERLEAAIAAAPPGVATDGMLLRRSAIAGTFLAGLELARQHRLALQQEESFGAIRVRCAAETPQPAAP